MFFVIIASIEIESVSVSLVHKATDRLFLCGITSKDICNSQSVCFGQSVSFEHKTCLLYTSPSPRDQLSSRMPSSA